MNALAMPISSRTAEDTPSACFCTKSPRILDERSATWWQTFARSSDSFLSAGCISHDAIIAQGTLGAAGIVQVMQMGYRLAHRKEGLVRVERPAKQHAEQLSRAFRCLQGLKQFRQAIAMVALQLLDPSMRAAERLAMRRQDQHIVGEFP